MVTVAVVSIICLTILLGIIFFTIPDIIRARKDAQIEVSKQKQIADDRVHARWKEMLELEAQLSAPALPADVQVAKIELSKVEAEARKLEAEAARDEANLAIKKYMDHGRYR